MVDLQPNMLCIQELELPVVAPDNRNGAKVLATGIAGLDDILGGGVSHNHLYLIEGDPGRERRPSPFSSCWKAPVWDKSVFMSRFPNQKRSFWRLQSHTAGRLSPSTFLR